ncbi:polysaccharide deacetylase family protein [Lachnotalea sp. AF33-28]|uniref:polysaccharide deacetylase family protein n=1 Tax=Lachnotalea sp. AF33-28 TaxID=2292046 RepID=UPI000E491D03|nr:polysaccharide deacetylase family protein [Lachnotalea sp. AF33-28]RHP31238.1 peptidoglycan N-acetylglucosamine deacetylase [Lachnotalea sp. AF33-28]
MKWKNVLLCALVCVLNGCLILGLFTIQREIGVGDLAADSGEVAPFTKEEETKYVALTFDDGPHARYTEELLDGLKERGVRATFFLIGKSIEGNEDVIKRMSQEGHLIGNHTYSHVQLSKETVESAVQEIEKTNQEIFAVTGKVPEYIRPPFGSWNSKLDDQVEMTVVLWTVDPLDWKTQNTQYVVNHIKKNVKNNSIILLHDVYKTSVQAALEIVDCLQEEGYEFVTVDELMLE